MTAVRRPRARPTGRAFAACAAAAAAAGLASFTAAGDAPAEHLGPVVVTATRTERPAFEVPASIDTVDAAQIDANKLGVNLSEMLGSVPGLLVRDRQNYAQDQQISIRGFGSRAQFGIVGIRLYADGIPATMPDGQGQATHFSLDAAERIEVLRGPFSALYGNASGGVIQIFTADGVAPAEYSAEAVGGSYGTTRDSLRARGNKGGVGYNLDFTHFQTDGYRDHSQARREIGNARFSFKPFSGNTLSVIGNLVSIPEAQDAQGLTREQFEADPRQAAASALSFDTRKSTGQVQGGVVDEQRLDDSRSLRMMGYYGNRVVKQYQSIPLASQSPATSPGGVIDLHTAFGGGDLRFIDRERLFDAPLSVVAGLSYDESNSHRRGYNNYVATASGDQTGVQGELRRDEVNRLHDFDQYLQFDWVLSERWALMAGVRHIGVNFESQDRYITYKSDGTPANPDDSGAKSFYATTPVAGLMYKPSDRLHFYANYGEGFDTPTFDNTAYRPDGQPGLNFALQPARTGSGELGAKWRPNPVTQLNLALFRSLTRDEIVVASSQGGRSTYQNAGRTRRQGVELSLDARLYDRLRWQLAYTYLDATYREAYITCTKAPCPHVSDQNPLPANAALIKAGNRTPGVPQSDLYSALRWGRDTGWNAALEGSYVSDIPVNDTNSAAAPAYGLLSLNGGYVWDLARWRIQAYVRLDNLLDTDYVGAVIINDGNQQYYQPGAGRSAYGGVSLAWRD